VQHYSSINYWTAGWVYPRGRLREPFPRRRRGLSPALIPYIPRPVLVNGPLIFGAATIYRRGMQQGEAYRPGAKQGEIYRPGMMQGEASG